MTHPLRDKSERERLRWKIVPNPMRDDGVFLVHDLPLQPYPGEPRGLDGRVFMQLPPAVVPIQLDKQLAEDLAKAHNDALDESERELAEVRERLSTQHRANLGLVDLTKERENERDEALKEKEAWWASHAKVDQELARTQTERDEAVAREAVQSDRALNLRRALLHIQNFRPESLHGGCPQGEAARAVGEDNNAAYALSDAARDLLEKARKGDLYDEHMKATDCLRVQWALQSERDALRADLQAMHDARNKGVLMIARLEARVENLRAALEKIARKSSWDEYIDGILEADDAAAALAESESAPEGEGGSDETV